MESTIGMNTQTDLVAMAARIAKKAHDGQYRRDGITPYIKHPENVAKRLHGDQYAEAVGWLHDVLEDTKETSESLRTQGIPDEIIACVVKLTKRDDLNYEDYLAEIRADPLAKKVKIADMLSNLSDSPTNKQIIKYAKGLLVLLA
jgi:(p)ppGpp synthase/HD superfamily hydrolase